MLLVNAACGGFVQLLTSKVAAVRAAPAGGIKAGVLCYVSDKYLIQIFIYVKIKL